MPDTNLVPAPTANEADPTKLSPPLDVRSIVSNPLDQNPKTILFSVPSKNPIPVSKNTPVDPTEAIKTIVSKITEPFLFIIAPISYKPETVLLHLEELNQ